MDLFQSIEELEKKNSLIIKEKLSIFEMINTDSDIFEKAVLNNKKKSEVEINF